MGSRRGVVALRTGRSLAALVLVWAACTACVSDDAGKAAELGWSRPDAGQRWCQVLDDSEVAALAEMRGEPGSPWQELHSRRDEWSCTVAATMQGRGLDREETPPSLLSLSSRLLSPKTPETVAAGNHVPVGDYFSERPVPGGRGTWIAASAGEYLVRQPCRRPDNAGPVPDELQVQLLVEEPDAIDAARLRGATAAAWLQAAEAHGCRT